MIIKCITFDITNTLIRVASNSNVALHYSNIIRQKFDQTYQLDIELANLNFKKYFKSENEVNPGYGFSKNMESVDWWGNVVKKVIKADLELKGKPDLFDDDKLEDISYKIYDEFKQAHYWEKYKNCDYVLNELKKMNLKLGVVSNFDERLFDIIKNLGIEKYFDFICVPWNSQGMPKPYSKIFMNALLKSKCKQASELVHVGDSFDLDYTPSKTIGFNSILLKHETVKSNGLNKLPDVVRLNRDFAFDLDELLNKIKKF